MTFFAKKSKYGNLDPDLSKNKILNIFLKNEKSLPIGFQIALNHYQMMIFWKDIAKLPKICYLDHLLAIHALIKCQYIVTPNGLVANLFGSAETSHNNAYLVAESEISQRLEKFYLSG